MKGDAGKVRARDEFKEFLQAAYSKDYGQLSDWQKTLAGVRFYVTAIHNPLSW